MNLLQSFNFKVLKQAKPVIFTTLINKVGSIGLSLIPILLVENHTSTEHASYVMSAIKVTLIFGTLTSGWFVDRMGPRFVVLCSLLMSAVGLGLLPFAPTAFLIAILGMIAQYGDGVMRVAFRVLLTNSVPFENHKAALAWIRTASNVGQILSFSVGAIGGALGATTLFLFDSFTSFAAFLYGLKILPNPKGTSHSAAPKLESSARQQEHLLVFIICAVIFAGYTFFYEIYMAAVAGRLELLHPHHGLRIFSLCMVINTVLCTVLALPATDYFKRPSRVFPASIFATYSAVLMGTYYTQNIPLVYFSAFLMSASEIAIMSLTQFALIRLTPNTKNSTTWYSSGLTLVHSGRIIGAAITFPWFIQTEIAPIHLAAMTMICFLILAFCFSVRRALDRATS